VLWTQQSRSVVKSIKPKIFPLRGAPAQYNLKLMVSVKDAAQNALAFAREVLGDSRVNSLLLEEIELSDNQTWIMHTISASGAGPS
jgi:hypothetical protein